MQRSLHSGERHQQHEQRQYPQILLTTVADSKVQFGRCVVAVQHYNRTSDERGSQKDFQIRDAIAGKDSNAVSMLQARLKKRFSNSVAA
jgi:hypothetical protein